MFNEDVLQVLDRHLAAENVGAFAGVPSTGRAVELAVAVAVDFRDGLMAGERFYWDAAGLTRQLGVAALDVAGETAVLVGGRSA